VVKRCGKCASYKSLTEFHRHGTGYQAWCKPCRKAYAAAHYQRNWKRRHAHNRRRSKEFWAWYISLKDGRPCADCGGVFHHAAMQWDHLDGAQKTASVSSLGSSKSRLRLLAEIEKCELVCANCHAVRTYERRKDSRPDSG
jgi:hypothetical protein